MDKNQDIIEEVVEVPEAQETVGNVKIANDVVATIAGIATAEITGVASMSSSFTGGIAEILGTKKAPSRGVKVDVTENNAVIDVYIVVDYGVRIPELAWEIQENVKNNVETMTGLSVIKVNIHIEGVSFEKESQKAEEPEEEIIVEEAEIEELPSDDEAGI